MKISTRMAKALNDQIGMEANASNYYLAMATWCEITGYEGAAGFFYKHSEEERQHMLKIIHYLIDLGVNSIIPEIKQPPKTFKSLESICKTALKNEQTVTKSIHKMVELSQKDKDHTTYNFLQWFVNEQIEEEKTFETILQKFDLIGRDKLAIYEIDKSFSDLITAESQNTNTENWSFLFNQKEIPLLEHEFGQYIVPILIISAVGIFVGSRILFAFKS